MKKIIFICAILLFSTISTKLSTTAQEKDAQWLKLNNNIYIDKSSITKTIDGASAWFKIYDLSKNKTLFDKINGVSVYHKLIKYEAGCNIGALFYLHTKLYDKDGSLLYDEINNHDVGADFSTYYNGKIIYKALCGN